MGEAQRRRDRETMQNAIAAEATKQVVASLDRLSNSTKCGKVLDFVGTLEMSTADMTLVAAMLLGNAMHYIPEHERAPNMQAAGVIATRTTMQLDADAIAALPENLN